VIVDVGFLREKYQQVQQKKISFQKETGRASKIIHIDAQQKESASKRH